MGYHQRQMPRLEVRFVTRPRRGYAVFSDGEMQGAVSFSRDMAEEKLTTLRNRARRAAKAREIPCLRCRTTFLSEGPHNRMCDPCRQTAGVGALI